MSKYKHSTQSIEPDPRFNKGDRVVAKVHTPAGWSLTFSASILEPRWNGSHHVYLVEDLESNLAVLVPEEQLSLV